VRVARRSVAQARLQLGHAPPRLCSLPAQRRHLRAPRRRAAVVLGGGVREQRGSCVL